MIYTTPEPTVPRPMRPTPMVPILEAVPSGCADEVRRDGDQCGDASRRAPDAVRV
jgi:hypothetical protein